MANKLVIERGMKMSEFEKGCGTGKMNRFKCGDLSYCNFIEVANETTANL